MSVRSASIPTHIFYDSIIYVRIVVRLSGAKFTYKQRRWNRQCSFKLSMVLQEFSIYIAQYDFHWGLEITFMFL